ncbi:MAG: DNA translocase FtsK 4TM domain-containing protein, partial [bacterium]|nr:DNA translocase FtsK 4TM domain-containing protein [bacterium]
MAKQKKQSEKSQLSLVRTITAPKLNLAAETKRGIAIVIFLILAGVTALSLVGSAGVLGQFIFRMFAMLFGVMGYLVPVLLILIAWILFQNKYEGEENPHPYFRTYFGIFLVAGAIAGLIHSIYIDEGAVTLANQGRAGGFLGALFAGPLVGAFGFWAGDLLLIGLLI